jgi:hypothetical protein
LLKLACKKEEMRILSGGFETPTGQSVGYYLSPLSLSIKESLGAAKVKEPRKTQGGVILIRASLPA